MAAAILLALSLYLRAVLVYKPSLKQRGRLVCERVQYHYHCYYCYHYLDHAVVDVDDDDDDDDDEERYTILVHLLALILCVRYTSGMIVVWSTH